MDKKILIKYIEGTTTTEESQKVLEWIDKSKANEDYYVSLLNMKALEGISSAQCPVDISDKEMHEIESQITNTKKKNNLRFVYAIAATIILLVSVFINVWQYTSHQEGVKRVQLAADKSSVLYSYYTDKGVKGKIVLPDSTVVWLNSCSKITFPIHFSKEQRDVQFEGEGYFCVAKNTHSPMIVTTPKGMNIKVVGTKFVIKSYSNDNFEQATLFSGKILVSNDLLSKEGSGKKTKVTEMIPGESITFGEKIKPVRSFNVDTLKSSAWKRGKLLFQQTPMTEVCKTLERWHGLDIIVKDKDLYNYNFTADLGSESIVQIMELLKFTMPISYIIESNTVYITHR